MCDNKVETCVAASADDDHVSRRNSEGNNSATNMNMIAESLQINDKYLTDEFSSHVRDCLDGNTENSLPFPHFSLHDFVNNSNLSNELRNELNGMKWERSSNDLYEFHQTNIPEPSTDVRKKFPYTCAFYEFILNEVHQWLVSVTGVELTDKVSINGSKYCHTDLLLPHDDRMPERAFAFIYYLSPNWKNEFGGCLQLYESNSTGSTITALSKSIVPAENAFVFFRVQNNSWHSVQEVFAENHERLSINGWFHSKKIPPWNAKSTLHDISYSISHIDFNPNEVLTWINNTYVKGRIISNIYETFSNNREILLSKFLKPDKYESVLNELEALDSDCFMPTGPLNRRSLSSLNESRLNPNSNLAAMIRFFQSDSFLYLLTKITSIELCRDHCGKLEEPDLVVKKRRIEANNGEYEDYLGPDTTEFHSSFYRFESGCYTLVDDQLTERNKKQRCWLDVSLCFTSNTGEWSEDFGGYTSYFDKDNDADDEFVRVPVSGNSLAIVMCEQQFLSFTKYVNSKAKGNHFYRFTTSFYPILREEVDDNDKVIAPNHATDDI